MNKSCGTMSGLAAANYWNTTARTVNVESTWTSSCLGGDDGRELDRVERFKESIVFNHVGRESEERPKYTFKLHRGRYATYICLCRCDCNQIAYSNVGCVATFQKQTIIN